MNKWFLSPAWSRRCLRAHNIGSLCHSLHRPKVSLYGRIFARSYGKGLGGPKPLRTLQTLDATRLSRSDFVDLSKVTRAILYGQNKTQRSAIDYMTTGTHHHPFPENTHGFFYFVPAPHTSVQLASEVRFRITSHDHPSSFAEGSDLLFPDGTPWRIPLAYLARGSGCSYLRDLLLQGQLVTSSSLSHCVSLPHRVDSKSRIIHSIGQIFSLNLKDLRPTVYFATEHSLHHKHLEPFLDRRRAKPKAPYAGSVACCFEESALSSPGGTRTLNLRVKKITSPIEDLIPEYDGWITKPKEGQLVMRTTWGGGHRPWSFDAEKRLGAAVSQALYRDV